MSMCVQVRHLKDSLPEERCIFSRGKLPKDMIWGRGLPARRKEYGLWVHLDVGAEGSRNPYHVNLFLDTGVAGTEGRHPPSPEPGASVATGGTSNGLHMESGGDLPTPCMPDLAAYVDDL